MGCQVRKAPSHNMRFISFLAYCALCGESDHRMSRLTSRVAGDGDSWNLGINMDRYYTASEIAERTGIPERTVMRAMQLNRLRWTTANGTTRPRRAKAEWVTDWLEGKERRD